MLKNLNYRKIFLPKELTESHCVTNAIRFIGDISATDDNEEPVFIFSAGWRAGSTLLQRLVVSSNQVVVWGEPLGEAGLLPRLAYSFSAISSEWPGDIWSSSQGDLYNLSNQWIANLTPPYEHLWKANRNLILTWLRDPAQKEFGISRWGLKEVRLTIDHAHYLKWLFPKAKFLFIYRNPLLAYRSWKRNNWPGKFTAYHSYSPIIFARHWRLLVEGYLSGYKDVNGMLISFEDLVAGNISLKDIEEHIGVDNLSSEVLDNKIDSPKGLIKKRDINTFDRTVIQLICGPLLKKLGYQGKIDNCK